MRKVNKGLLRNFAVETGGLTELAQLFETSLRGLFGKISHKRCSTHSSIKKSDSSATVAASAWDQAIDATSLQMSHLRKKNAVSTTTFGVVLNISKKGDERNLPVCRRKAVH